MIEFEFLRKIAGDWDYEDPYEGQSSPGPQNRSQPQRGGGDESLRDHIRQHLRDSIDQGGHHHGGDLAEWQESTPSLEDVIRAHDADHADIPQFLNHIHD
jgi:hypothetical protein